MGRYVTLEPLDAARHAGELFEASPGSEVALHIWDYLPWGPWKSEVEYTNVLRVGAAAPAMGLQVQVFNAATSGEIDAAFATMARERPDALYVVGGSLFNSRRLQLGMLSARHALPAAFPSRDYPESGGLMSYGANVRDAFRQVGAYAGRILKGAKPSDLPVVRATKFELVINAETARILGLDVPATLLATADEVIE